MLDRIVIGVAGSSGSRYAKALFDRLAAMSDHWTSVGVVMSPNAETNWALELGSFSREDYPFSFYGPREFSAPFASGSARYGTMIICPCSMGTLGRIAQGVSDDLMTRAADVILKERRRLIVVPRETPLNLIHLKNMVALTEAGGIILPASPSFYASVNSLEDAVMTVVDRILDLAGLPVSDTYRWGGEASS